VTTGDITGAKRPRYQANERFDSGDADAASRGPLEFGDAIGRALLTTPRATGGSSMPGLLISGLSLTLNPTGPTDNKVRIGAEVGIAVDANGRTIIKPAGSTVDVTIPAGSHQVYLYFTEDPTDTAQRRFLTVAAPYTEYPNAMATSFQGTYGVHVRSGTNANTVVDDVVNGVTTALVCIGIVTNTAGEITCSGHAALTSPNGRDITNRMSSVVLPTTLPALSTRSGSPQTLHDLLIAALYMLAQTAWKGATTGLVAYSGTSTSIGAGTLTDTAQAFVVSELIGGLLVDSASARFPITANTATQVTTTAGNPAAGAYTIYAPVARNNHGAFTAPTYSVQKLYEQLIVETFTFFPDPDKMTAWSVTGDSADLTIRLVASGAGSFHLNLDRHMRDGQILKDVNFVGSSLDDMTAELWQLDYNASTFLSLGAFVPDTSMPRINDIDVAKLQLYSHLWLKVESPAGGESIAYIVLEFTPG